MRDWDWDPLAWKLPIPPKVGDGDGRRPEVGGRVHAHGAAGRTAGPSGRSTSIAPRVILGNAMAGEKHYLTALRIMFPELARELERRAELRGAARRRARDDRARAAREPRGLAAADHRGHDAGRAGQLPRRPGRQPVQPARAELHRRRGLRVRDGRDGRDRRRAARRHEFDAAITGGIDRNMGATTFVKFCAIGALSATGTRPYADGADGFVMGEGAGAVRAQAPRRRRARRRPHLRRRARRRRLAATARARASPRPTRSASSFAIERAWRNAGLSPAECTLIEGHGTSTARRRRRSSSNSLAEAFAGAGLRAGLDRARLGQVEHRPPQGRGGRGRACSRPRSRCTTRCCRRASTSSGPNPNLDWSGSPFAVNTELRDWEVARRRARASPASARSASAAPTSTWCMEEYVPGRLQRQRPPLDRACRRRLRRPWQPRRADGRVAAPASARGRPGKPPLRGALVLGAADEAGARQRAAHALAEARQGRHLDPRRPARRAARARADRDRLRRRRRAGREGRAGARRALRVGQPGGVDGAARARHLPRQRRARARSRSSTPARARSTRTCSPTCAGREPVVADLFDEADAIMRAAARGPPRCRTSSSPTRRRGAMAQAEEELRRTEITQPAVLTVDIALTRLLGRLRHRARLGHGPLARRVRRAGRRRRRCLRRRARGRQRPRARDGEPAGRRPGRDGRRAGAARGGRASRRRRSTATSCSPTSTRPTRSCSAAPPRRSSSAVAALQERGHDAIPLPVSHAFHTEIVAPASVPLRATLQRLGAARRRSSRSSPTSTASSTRPAPERGADLDILGRQVASPVQFVKGLHTLYDDGRAGVRRSRPQARAAGLRRRRARRRRDVSLVTNHPKAGRRRRRSTRRCAASTPRASAPARAVTARPSRCRRARPRSRIRGAAARGRARRTPAELAAVAGFAEPGRARARRRRADDRAGGHHRRRARAARHRAALRRRQPRAPAATASSSST